MSDRRRSILVNEPVQVKERETIHYRDVTHFEKKNEVSIPGGGMERTGGGVVIGV